MRHPEIDINDLQQVEGLKGFYMFKDEIQLTTYGRSRFISLYLEHLATYGMTNEDFQDGMKAISNCLKATKENPNIEIGKAEMIIQQMRSRSTMFSDFEAIYQVAARVIFTLKDDLTTDVPPDELKRRIEELKKKGIIFATSIPFIKNIFMRSILLEDLSPKHLEKQLKANQVVVETYQDFWREIR